MAFYMSVVIILVSSLKCAGQERTYRIRTVAFYNLENLFDTIDDPDTFDEEFTPGGKYQWDTERYLGKIQKLAMVISGIGSALPKGPPDILGVCEAENFEVLSDLVAHKELQPYDYGIIHRDGPDERGIDVALLYRKDSFHPVGVRWHPLLIRNEERFREFTRDQLVVHGFLDGLPLYVIVNHWPSRRGGELRSRAHRVAAAELNLKILDSIRRITPEPLIIALGDFNDNPSDYAMRQVLKLKKDTFDLDNTALFNPMASLFRKGHGSLAYRDSWSLFDQIYMSGNLANGDQPLQFWKVKIHDPGILGVGRGTYKGYPLRTYTAGRYTGGYSDHFPVYAYFIREESAPLFGND